MDTVSTINNPPGGGGAWGSRTAGCTGAKCVCWRPLLLLPQSTIQNNVIFSPKIHICHCKFTSRLIK